MEIKISIPQAVSWVEIQVITPITAEHEKGFIREALDAGEANNRDDLLVDVSTITNTATKLEKYDMAYYAIDQMGAGRQARIAVLAAPDDLSHDFIEVVMQNAGFVCQMFRDRDAAITWLKIKT